MTAISEPPDVVLAKQRPRPWPVGRYVLTRFLLIFPTAWILVTVVFFMMRVTGDPVTASLGGRLSGDELTERVAEAGYDRPVLVQYVEYLGRILRGDFGTTASDGRQVSTVLTTYGAATLELVIFSLIVAFAVGVPLGMLAAAKRDRPTDAMVRFFSILCYSTPLFFSGLILKLIFSVGLKVTPVSGRSSTDTELKLQLAGGTTGINILDAIRLGDGAAVADVLRHAVLPAVVLGLLTAGVFIRLVRTNTIGTLNSDYVAAARSRGVRERSLVGVHALRPALVPIITVMGLQIAMLLGGAVLTETTFEWKGLGYMLAQYLAARDFVAVQGIVALLAVIISVTSFLVDVVAVMIDPRLRTR